MSSNNFQNSPVPANLSGLRASQLAGPAAAMPPMIPPRQFRRRAFTEQPTPSPEEKQEQAKEGSRWKWNTSALRGVRLQLAGTVFLLVTPAALTLYILKLPWGEFTIGLLALTAAWFGGEVFVMRQVRMLSRAVRKLADGDYGARTGLRNNYGELGELGRDIDSMATRLEARDRNHASIEQDLMVRAHQQAGAAALGQIALVSTDYNSLLTQTVSILAHTLEVDFCDILDVHAEGSRMVAQCSFGWQHDHSELAPLEVSPLSLTGYVLSRNEPAIVMDWKREKRFQYPRKYEEHRIRSSVCVPIRGRDHTLGLLLVHVTQPRDFTGDDVQFLLAASNHLATAGERLQTEVEMHKLASFAQLNPNAAMELTADGEVTYCNDAALRLALSLGIDHPRQILPTNIQEILRKTLASTKNSIRIESHIRSRALAWSFHPVLPSKKVHCYVEEITEKLSLEAQLRQSQKMDSLGHLAAGVAHDFNNMLTVIQGHSGLLMAKTPEAPELHDSAQAVYFASERAASLTRQLLMFSRKSVMQPKLLDLRECVSNITKLLQRVLGETIELEFNPPSQLPLVHGDAGMLEQVIMNLAVNARDAMPKEGRLTIAAGVQEIPPEYVEHQPQARPGEFVRLTVSDTGCGMSAETRERIFEPFFTTKEVGKGTGLGLATVFGIVKQHEGWIEVESEIGEGTTFTIYLPASDVIANGGQEAAIPPQEVRGGQETVLLVEDESTLRDMAILILRECGYRVLKAASGVEALDVWRPHQNEIDLVVTDMVMPEGLSGMDLAQQLIQERPNLKVLFTSGYSVEDIGGQLASHPNYRFMEKPYTRHTLAQAVRELLDAQAEPVPPASDPVMAEETAVFITAPS